MTSADHSGRPVWIESLHPDPERAVDFYRAVLGWNAAPASPGFDGTQRWIVSLGDRVAAAIGQAPPGLPHAAWVMYVEVDDVPTTRRATTDAAGTVFVGTESCERAVLGDPSLAVFGICRRGSVPPLLRDGSAGTWAMSALHTPSLDDAEAFYSSLFGWRLPRGPGISRWTSADQDETIAVATQIDPEAPVPPHWAFNVAATDVDAIATAAVAAGGSVLIGPFDTPGFRNVVIEDPWHAVVALSQSG